MMLLQTLFAAVMLSGPASVEVRVDGEGYLRFAHDYRITYAKGAKLVVSDGKLTHITGARIMPTISVPTDAVTLEVDLQGNVTATSKRGKSACGRLVLAVFGAGTALSQEDVFLTSAERPGLANPGEGTNGVIRVVSGPTVTGRVSDSKKSGRTKTPVGKSFTKQPRKQTNPPHSPSLSSNQSRAEKPLAGSELVAAEAPVPTKARIVGMDGETWAPVTITISPKSWVTGSKIYLGDVAKIEADAKTAEKLSTVFLGETPTFNLKRILTRQSVNTRLLAAGRSLDSLTIIVPEGAEVWRKGQVVTGDQLSQVALAYAKQQLNLEGEMTLKEPLNELQVPFGKLDIVPVAISDSIPNVTVTIALKVDGKNVKSLSAKLTANVAEGVKAGDTIKIRIRSNGAVVEISGKARYNALVGQTVTVITSRNTSHTGKVVSPGIVEVSL